MTKLISIGICAYNEARRLSALLDSVRRQVLPSDCTVLEILVVASGCTDGTDRIVADAARSDPRFILIQEADRRGKASALNQILTRYRGNLLVLINADACLVPGSLFELLKEMGDDTVEVACGCPIPETSSNRILNMVEGVWWRLHNRTLQFLSDLGRGNHCCDEFMVVTRGFAESIPQEIINDGAYFGVLAASRGTTVRFCPRAAVIVETPSSLAGLVSQRQRILTGHRQVRRLLGRSPFTLEGLARSNPTMAAKILLLELCGSPVQTLVFLCVGGPLEVVSHILSFLTEARGSGFQPAWPMVE